MIPVEAIQQVMEKLGRNMDDANFLMKDKVLAVRMEGYGRKTELRNAIMMLEEVIAQYAPSDQRDAAEPERNDQCKQTE